MAAVSLWVRREWSRRWVGLVGLGLLIALVGGVTLAVVNGARRTSTAFERFREATNSFEVVVEVQAPETEDGIDVSVISPPDELAERIAAVDGVDGVTVASYVAAGVGDDPGTIFTIVRSAQWGAAPTSTLLRGRLPADDAADEIAINEAGAEAWGVDIGGEVELTTLATDQFEAFVQYEFGEPAGPRIPMRVTGIIRDIEDISDTPEPFFVPSTGFIDRWGDEVAHVTGAALVNTDLTRADEVIASLQEAVGPYFSVALASEQDDFAERVADTIDVSVTVLAVFALAAALAGFVVIGQALIRSAGTSGADPHTLAALGLGRRRLILATAAVLAPAALLGSIAAVPLALALSPLFPRGLARVADPDPGLWFDGAVLTAGTVLLLVAVVLLTLLTAWRAVRRGQRASTVRLRRAELVERVAASIPAVPGLGARFALERDRRGAPGGMAGIAGAALLVGGLVGVGTVERSRDHLLAAPRLYGADWDLQMSFFGVEDQEKTIEQLSTAPDVDAVGTRSKLLAGDGELRVHSDRGRFVAEPVAYDWHKGSRPPVVPTGRPPGAGETAIGTELAHRLDASIGDTIVVEGYSGDVSLRVTGWLVNPGSDELDTGLVVTPDTLEAMRGRDCPEGSDLARCRVNVEGVAVAFRDGTDPGVAAARLRAVQPSLEEVPVPSIVNNLGQIGSTPWLLAGFLALIGGAGLAHSLMVGVRRHRHDVAVVRALGLRPAQARSVVRWQASILAGLGAGLGLLAGLLVGRLVWQRIVDGVGAVVSVELPMAFVVLAPLVAIGLGLVLSLLTGRRMASLSPATVLRAE
jgi:predicted lysophospholipase L1 biosynthesis ABC-type transport system permease subunit